MQRALEFCLWLKPHLADMLTSPIAPATLGARRPFWQTAFLHNRTRMARSAIYISDLIEMS